MKKSMITCDIILCGKEIHLENEHEAIVTFLDRKYHLCPACKKSCSDWMDRALSKATTTVTSDPLPTQWIISQNGVQIPVPNLSNLSSYNYGNWPPTNWPGNAPSGGISITTPNPFAMGNSTIGQTGTPTIIANPTTTNSAVTNALIDILENFPATNA